jgi:Domain of unknown function (DUF5134)
VLTPIWLADALAATMLVVSAYCAGRPLLAARRGRSTTYSVDLTHTAMGVAMAGMLTAHLVSVTPWIVVFAAVAGWFTVRGLATIAGAGPRSLSAGGDLRHVLTCGAMVYMLVATPTVAASAMTVATPAPMAASMSVGGASDVHLPTLALVLAVVMVGVAVMAVDRLPSPARSAAAAEGAADPRAAARPLLAPRSLACCQVAMSITMGYMLVTLL